MINGHVWGKSETSYSVGDQIKKGKICLMHSVGVEPNLRSPRTGVDSLKKVQIIGPRVLELGFKDTYV